MEPSPKALDCGCVRGRIGCADALTLLKTLASAYADGVRTGCWERFNEHRCALERHYAAHTSPESSCKA